MATRQKHNIYIYNRVVTEYFYAKMQYYGLLSRPTASPATRNTKIQILLPNILILQDTYLNYKINIYLYSINTNLP